VLGLTVAAVLAGCSASKDAAPATEPQQVGMVISSLNDVTSKPNLLTPWFAQGAAPPAAELRKYAAYTFKPNGKPTVSGDTATAKVRVLDDKDHQVAEVEWTLVREGDRWKLKSAPLP
jgi:hypothetical protein